MGQFSKVELAIDKENSEKLLQTNISLLADVSCHS